jgi:hypothetical protein
MVVKELLLFLKNMKLNKNYILDITVNFVMQFHLCNYLILVLERIPQILQIETCFTFIVDFYRKCLSLMNCINL